MLQMVASAITAFSHIHNIGKNNASLKAVLDEAVHIIDVIKTRPLQSRIFADLCKDMASHQTTLLLQTEEGGFPQEMYWREWLNL